MGLAAFDVGSFAYEVGGSQHGPQWGTSWDRQTATVLHLRDEDGVPGYSVTWPEAPTPHALALNIAAWLRASGGAVSVDGHPEANLGLFNRIRRLGGSTLVVAAIDNALWDARGRKEGVPVHRLLGTRHDALPAQAASRIDQFLPDAEAVVEHVLETRADGYGCFKLHLWGDPVRDVQACAAVREACGREFGLALDPIGRYGIDDAITVGRELARLGFLWLEDPIDAERRADYPKLAEEVGLPLAAADALLWSVNDYLDAIALGCPGILRLDPGRQGITLCQRLARLAEARGMRCEFHGFGPEANSAAAIHCGLSQAALSYYEVCVPRPEFEVPGVAVETALRPDGRVAAPTLPGIGLEVDWPDLERRLEFVR